MGDPMLDTDAGFRAAVIRAAQQRESFSVMGVRFVPEPVPGDDLPEEWVTLIERHLPWLLPRLMQRETARILVDRLRSTLDDLGKPAPDLLGFRVLRDQHDPL